MLSVNILRMEARTVMVDIYYAQPMLCRIPPAYRVRTVKLIRVMHVDISGGAAPRIALSGRRDKSTQRGDDI